MVITIAHGYLLRLLKPSKLILKLPANVIKANSHGTKNSNCLPKSTSNTPTTKLSGVKIGIHFWSCVLKLCNTLNPFFQYGIAQFHDPPFYKSFDAKFFNPKTREYLFAVSTHILQTKDNNS